MTDQTQDRIKLAEWMGWELVEHCGTERWIAPGSLGFTGYLNEPAFDPFTDANDDYAVLEFIRTSENEPQFTNFRDALRAMTDELGAHRYVWSYRIGDIARAALKVINND